MRAMITGISQAWHTMMSTDVHAAPTTKGSMGQFDARELWSKTLFYLKYSQSFITYPVVIIFLNEY